MLSLSSSSVVFAVILEQSGSEREVSFLCKCFDKGVDEDSAHCGRFKGRETRVVVAVMVVDVVMFMFLVKQLYISLPISSMDFARSLTPHI